MKKITVKKINLLPPAGRVYVKEVTVVEEDHIYEASTVRTDKEIKFGEVIFANDKELIGKIITIDPWRQTPITIGGTRYIELNSENGFTTVDMEEQNEQ